MFGFILKLIVLAVIGLGVIKFAPAQLKGFPAHTGLVLPSKIDVKFLSDSFKNIDLTGFGQKLSQSLDTLVTHPGHSPIILGVQITDDSLNAIVDVLQKLPPDELQQIKSFICQPATPSEKLK